MAKIVTQNFENVICIYPEEMSKDEVAVYVEGLVEKYQSASIIEFTLDGEYVNVIVTDRVEHPFERIRRITGYLVGDTKRWNDAKRAELNDRVKHFMEGKK